MVDGCLAQARWRLLGPSCAGAVAVFSCWAQAVSFTAYLNDNYAAAADDDSVVDYYWWWRGSAL